MDGGRGWSERGRLRGAQGLPSDRPNVDAFIGVNGESINDIDELTVYLETQTTVGDTIELIIRDGQ